MKYAQSKQALDMLEKLLNQYKEYQQAQTEAEKDRIGDEMVYPDPVVWMMYKHKAYAGTDHEITTVGGLREHSSGHGGICAKRFDFLTKSLQKEFPDALPLEEFYESDELDRLVLDINFMHKWQEHEFYKKDGAVAKWQNYKL